MTTGFQARLEAGIGFEKELVDLLKNDQRVEAVCLNGTEHTHPDFVKRIRSDNSDQAAFIRFAPDGIVLKRDKKIIHFEAKAAKTIEKHAHTHYMRLSTMNCSVFVFVKMNGKIYHQDVLKLKLIDGNESVKKFPVNMRFPVIDGWICPRHGHGRVGAGSGTPYRYIDFSSMEEFIPNKLPQKQSV